MIPKGNNVTIKVEPRDKVRESGIIIPDTVTPKNQEWGECVAVSGNTEIEVGERVLFLGKGCKEENGIKLVPNIKLLLWGV